MNKPYESFSGIAKVNEFTSERIHIPGQESMVKWHLVDGDSHFGHPIIYANGDSCENEGNVSISLNDIFITFAVFLKDFELNIIVCILDTEDDRRFLRSFSYNHKCAYHDWIIPAFQYIARKTLLSESTVLLPGDCLVIQIDITVQYNENTDIYDSLESLNYASDIVMEKSDKGYIYKLNLDSDFGHRLYKLSSVFKNMFDLTNKGIKYIEFKPDIYKDEFLDLYQIIMESDCLEFRSVKDISDVYKTADKYDMPSIIETCRQLLKSMILTEDKVIIDLILDESMTILDIADMCKDEDLKKIINVVGKNETYFHIGQIDWKCKLVGAERGLFFTKAKVNEFDFYS